VESEPGEGSTFHFTAQFLTQTNRTRVSEALPREQLRDKSVLIVDDNFTNRRVLEGLLTRWGMRATAISGGRAALQALEEYKEKGEEVSLILLDGHMPEMDGFALAEQIQNNPKLSGATVMMLTSAEHMGDVNRCRNLGISAYLVKPVRPSELMEVICQVMQPGYAANTKTLGAPHLPNKTQHSRRVLLVEDNIVNQTLALQLLELRGHQVTIAPDGRAALSELSKQRFDVVLMDIQMPEMDGFERRRSSVKENRRAETTSRSSR